MNYDIIITIVLFFFFLDNISLRKKINSIDKELEDQKRKSYAGNFYVQLHQIDESKKIEIIMTMRKLTDLSLKEAKNIVDSVRPGIAPIIVSRVNSEYADILKKALEQSECKVTILEKEGIVFGYKIGVDFFFSYFFYLNFFKLHFLQIYLYYK